MNRSSPLHSAAYSPASILLTCLGYADPAVKTARLAQAPAEVWREVVELARQHGVAEFLFHHVQRLQLELPGEVVEGLKQEFRRNALRNMQMYQKLHGLLLLLQEKGIPVIVLKGAYLVGVVYEHLALRTMVDVDLLVKKEDLFTIDQELLASGCTPKDLNRVIAPDNCHFAYELPQNSLCVEVHWMLFASSLSFQVDTEGLWRRACPLSLAQAPALALSPEDLLLHLCLHTAKHTEVIRLRMLCDIGEVVRHFGTGLDWEVVASRARQWGAQRAVYLILRLAQELLEAAIPAGWLASLRPDDFDEGYLAFACQQVFASGASDTAAGRGYTGNIMGLWGPKDLGNKIKIIHSRLFLPKKRMALIYPAPPHSWRIYLYYPVRLKKLLLRYGLNVWRLARGDKQALAIAEHTNQVTDLRDWLMSG